MKKLLSLLSVLTISGTAIPTTIAASPYQKQENSEINYQQTSNKSISPQLANNNNSWWEIGSALWEMGYQKIEEIKDYILENYKIFENMIENLNTNKLFDNLFVFFEKSNDKIRFPKNQTPPLFISEDKNVNEYFKNLLMIIKYLQAIDIIREIRGQLNENGNPIFSGIDKNGNTNNRFFLNPDSEYDYFIVPVILEENNTSRRMELVFRSTDLYLQGFIVNNNYYYFSDDDTLNNIPDSNYNNIPLNYEGNYGVLTKNADFDDKKKINWEGIISSFFKLSKKGINKEEEKNKSQKETADSLIKVILATAESMRFTEVQNLIKQNNNKWSDFTPIILNWSRITKNAINYIENGSLLNFPYINDILTFATIISDYFWKCNNKKMGRTISLDQYCYENNFNIDNIEYGNYFYAEEKGRKKVVNLDKNITQILKIKNEEEFKNNFSILFLKDYRSNYKALKKSDWFNNFELDVSDFKINEWSYKLISDYEDKVGGAYINGKIYSNYRLYMDKKNELHMQIEIWMQGYNNGWSNTPMWIWLETGYFLSLNDN